MSNNSIFNKIINFFKSIFNPIERLAEGKVEEKKENDLEKIVNETKTENEKKKEKYVAIYNKVKSGEVDIKSLSFSELVAVNIMFDKEEEILEKDVEMQLENNKIKNKRIKELKRKKLIV